MWQVVIQAVKVTYQEIIEWIKYQEFSKSIQVLATHLAIVVILENQKMLLVAAPQKLMLSLNFISFNSLKNKKI
jgi:hypothetical protein